MRSNGQEGTQDRNLGMNVRVPVHQKGKRMRQEAMLRVRDAGTMQPGLGVNTALGQAFETALCSALLHYDINLVGQQDFSQWSRID